jgi:hypothetical protein
MDPPGQSESAGITNVSMKGDFTLVVGPIKKQIRIQPAILKETSKPFAVMLCDTWKAPNAQTIDLPDDDAAAMLEICLALHHKYSKLSTELSPNILKIAILADKYFLVETLACVASHYWLTRAADQPSPILERHVCLGMLQLATAACMFEDAFAFGRYTRSLFSDWARSYLAGGRLGWTLLWIRDYLVSSASQPNSRTCRRLISVSRLLLRRKGLRSSLK